MKMTLNTVGFVEQIIGRVEGNKKNAVINAILAKSFLNGTAYESLIEHISQKEIQKIQKDIEKIKKNLSISVTSNSTSINYVNEDIEEENDVEVKTKDVIDIENEENENEKIKKINEKKQKVNKIKVEKPEKVEEKLKVNKIEKVEKPEKVDINKVVKKNLNGMDGFNL